MPYVDLNTIHNPSTGTVPPATWGDQVRDNDEFLIDVPTCSVNHSTTQTVTDATLTAMSADTEDFDNNGMHSTVTNNSRITIQTAGRYLFYGTISFTGTNNTGLRRVSMRIDGTTTHTLMTTSAAPTATATVLTGTKSMVLSAGQYVECMAQHTASVSLSCLLVEFFAQFLTR